MVKEWVGFKKEILEAKKVEIELAQLQKSSSKTIDLASLDEVKQFDPKTQRIFEIVRILHGPYVGAPFPAYVGPVLLILVIAILAGVIYFALKVF